VKITFVSPTPNMKGGSRVVAIYANELARRGHDVTIVAQGFRDLSRKDQLKSVARGSWPKEPSRASHFDNSLARVILTEPDAPVRPEDVPDADLVIATWWETAFMIARFPPSKGRKVYFVQHHEVHSHLPSHISGGSYFLPLKKVTISAWLVDTMRDVYGDDDVAMVHNSVDGDQFFAPERGRQAKPTVGLLYSQVPFKGVDISLKALEIVRKTIPELQLVAFGLQPPGKDLPLPDGTTYHLRPDQEKLREIYASCDVWLCGSRAEGFHLPPSEAMACRCPVVSTRVGGPMDIITQGENGYLVDVGDVEALAARLIDVLSLDEAGWRKMSDAAYDSTQRYTWSDATDQFEAALTKLLA
jgi:glycosyltransferase involved in cell wall biosynthesis